MSKVEASAILPVYNQYQSLKTVVEAFSLQNVPKESFEIIIVDDGSDDELRYISPSFLEQQYNINCQIIHQNNRGRSAARNAGIEKARSEKIIFCDGDRFPKYNLIKEYINSNEDIVIGMPFDFFDINTLLKVGFSSYSWENIVNHSRLPRYFRNIEKIYDSDGYSDSNLSWMSFLVGNSCVKKSILLSTNGFNERFIDWGFEHFELALRLQKKPFKFFLNREACNFHIPHKRPAGFYDLMIQNSLSLLKKLHPYINEDIFLKTLHNEISIFEAENKIFINGGKL